MLPLFPHQLRRILPIYISYIQSAGLTTDTRGDVQDKVYLALKGEHFDGNDYAQVALDKGAKMVVVEEHAVVNDETRVHRVAHGLHALQALANYHRHQLGKPVFGITGSNGKTTTKELLARVLSKRFHLHATKGNLNNQIGVPLTLLDANPSDDMILIEMGTNEPGEIEILSQIAHPDYGLITNIGKAHIEKLLSLDGVLNEKTALYREINKRGGVCFVPIHDDRLMNYTRDWPNAYRFGVSDQPDLSPRGCTIQVGDTVPTIKYRQLMNKDFLSTHLYGVHNAINIAAAVAVGSYFGVTTTDIAGALASYRPDNHRSQIQHVDDGIVFCDAYNANPVSVRAALQSLDRWAASNKVAILGDMLELGASSVIEHRAVIDLMNTEYPDVEVFLVGQAFKSCTDTAFVDTDELISSGILQDVKQRSDVAILVKGSRSIKLERLYPHLGIHVE